MLTPGALPGPVLCRALMCLARACGYYTCMTAPDLRNAELIMDLAVRLARDCRLTVMTVTHNLNRAREFNSCLPMTDGGEIILDIDAAEKAKLSAKRNKLPTASLPYSFLTASATAFASLACSSGSK
jgi:ABC-type dipeptide/oligopeptide/nickel transport system ATPase subunit